MSTFFAAFCIVGSQLHWCC